MMKKRGFTLIELLVVVAIIGILAAMVLVSLNTARSKAKDARVKGSMSQLRADAEAYYADNNSYSGYTVNGTIESDIQKNNGTGTAPTVTATANAYAVLTTLSNGTTKICVDSTGVTRIGTDVAAANGACSGGTVQ